MSTTTPSRRVTDGLPDNTVRRYLDEEECKYVKLVGRMLSPTRKAILARQHVREIIRRRRFYARIDHTLQVNAA